MSPKNQFIKISVMLLLGVHFAFGDWSGTIKRQIKDKLSFNEVTNRTPDYRTSIITDTIEDGCVNQAGKAGDTGLKVWCWSDNVRTNKNRSTQQSIDSLYLKIDAECNDDQVKIVDGRLEFHVEPEAPKNNDSCERKYNMRSEVRTAPWKVNHAPGTEEWFGWNYTFGKDYQIDKINPWLFFQVHEGTWGETPLIAFWCMNQNGPGSGRAGEIHIVNNAHTSQSYYYPSGIVPKAGETLQFVAHVVWGDYSNGLLQVWINGQMVHNKRQRTIRDANPVGGNAKWGIYKWKWASKEGVQDSKKQGIFSLNTSMGPLRIITRNPSDSNYLKDSYKDVVPR